MATENQPFSAASRIQEFGMEKKKDERKKGRKKDASLKEGSPVAGV